MPEITMPRLSDTMEEGTIGRWLKEVGDPVAKGDILAEIETDKAVMELEAYDAGVMERVLVRAGETVPIGAVVAVVGTGDEGAAAVASAPAPGAESRAAAAAAPPDTAPVATAPAATAPAAAPAGRETVKASPMARAMARELGVDLTTIAGSGPGGRVVKADLERRESAAAAAPPAPAPAQPPAPAPPPAAGAPAPTTDADSERIPLTNMRKTVARRLAESAQSAPHFYLTTVVEADSMLALRAELNQRLAAAGEEVKVSVNDLIVKACANSLRTHPEVNVSWQGDAILQHHRIHIGIAVAVEGGLIVPVIRDADRKSVSIISREAKALIAKARANKLAPADYSGGTFSVTNLGMYGIDQFTAVINPPEAAILAVGASSPEVVLRDGQVTTRQVLRLTLAIDHRALDGATGAGFLQHLRELLEDPLRIVA